MSDEKPWYLSRTIWAALVSVAATIGSMIGLQVDPTMQSALTEGLLHLVSAIAGLLAIAGRVSASSRIS